MPPDDDLQQARRDLEAAAAALREREAWLAAQRKAFEAAMNGAPLAVSLGILIDAVVAPAGDGRRCAFHMMEGGKFSPVAGLPASSAEAGDGGACWSFPVETSAGRLVGSFTCRFPKPREATAHDRDMAAVLTQAAAIIMARHQDNAGLEKREAELARVQRIGQVGGINIEVAEGLRSWRSPEYLRLHGLPPEPRQETHAQWLARVYPQDRERAERVLFDAINGSGDSYDSEYRIVRPSDGAVRWIHARADIERDADGKPVRLVGAHVDITEQKQMQGALRESEERQAFLLRLADELRPLSDPEAAKAAACRLLGEAVGADRVYFVEYDVKNAVGTVGADFAAPGLTSLAGRYPFAAFGSTYRRISTGVAWVVEDVRDEPAMAQHEREHYTSRGVVSWVDVPLLGDGHPEAVLCAAQTHARQWTGRDIALIAETAERLWSAVQHGRAANALGESEERLRMALDAGRMGTWRFDLRTGRQQWSEQQFRLFGLDPGGEPPTRELFLSMVLPEDRPAVAFTDDDLRPGRGLLDAEFRIVRPDGRIRWLVSHTIVRRDAAGEAIEMIGLNWDVTEHRTADDALRESEEGLRMALEAGRMGTYRFDVHTGIEQWSDSEYELLGLERTDLPPTRDLFLSVVHPDDLHLVQYTEDDRRPPGTSLDTEFRIVRPDTGEIRYLTAHALARFGPDGKPRELIGVNQDVTDERRAQEALRATDERLQQFSRASSDVLWIRDAHTLQWEYLSPAFDRVYGVTRQDALKADNFQSWLSFILPEDRDTARAALERVADGERVAFEYRIRRPDGEVRWLRNTDFPIHDQSGRVTHVAGVGSDITQMRQAEEHRRFLLAELQHRVRNTLAVIRSIMRRTAETTASKEEFFTHLDGRVAAFARVQGAVTRDPTRGVDLAMLLADELRVVGAQEGRGLTITGPEVALAPKAAETLGLAVHELATNAIKHGALAGPNGSIDIAWTVTDAPDGQLQLVWTERGGRTIERPRRRGFGTEILERTLAYDLKAATELDFRPHGLICRISLPLREVMASTH